MRTQRSALGFTLIEVMITVAVFGTVTWYLGEVLIRQSRVYTVVDNLIETQQNLRAVGSLIEEEIRTTGFLVPEGAAICGWDTLAGTPDVDPDVLFVTASEVIDPAGMNNLQLGAGVNGIVAATVFGSASVAFQLSTLVLDGNAFYDLDANGTPESDFLFTAAPLRQGGVIFVDRGNPGRGTACGLITAINTATNTITVDLTVAGAATPVAIQGAGGFVDLVAVPAHAYWIQGPNGPNPTLMRDGMVLAPDVEDLQIAFFYDLDDDDVVDNTPVGNVAPPFHSAVEYPGSNMPGSVYAPGSGNWDNSLLEELRVTLVARTRTQDPEVLLNPALAQGQPQSFENRAPFGGAVDGFRRRSITMTVDPRNVGNRAAGF